MCFVLSVSPFVFVHSHKRQLINIDLQDCSVAVAVRGLSEEMINRTSNVEMSGRTRLGHTHTHKHTHAPLTGRKETGANRISQ